MSDARLEGAQVVGVPAGGDAVQPSACLIELSHDWIVLRASENVHHLARVDVIFDRVFGKQA